MGYMAYARKNYEQSENVHSTAEMVNAVENDLDNDDLPALRTLIINTVLVISLVV